MSTSEPKAMQSHGYKINMDQRRRTVLRYPAVITVGFEMDSSWHHGKASDISLGGLQLQSPIKLVPQRVFTLKIHLLGEDPITTQGKVIWCRDDRAGIQFENMDPTDILILAQWLKRS